MSFFVGELQHGGTDQLVLDGAGATFDFTTLADNKVQSIEAIDFAGSGNNTLKLGLMDAIEAFDTDRHVRFSTFSAVRIRGAILDELRSLDWVPRLVRSNSRKLETATRELEAELGRTPCDDELGFDSYFHFTGAPGCVRSSA